MRAGRIQTEADAAASTRGTEDLANDTGTDDAGRAVDKEYWYRCTDRVWRVECGVWTVAIREVINAFMPIDCSL